ncbi:winged helix-turn-helix transcriptional regulator [Halomicroarcula sp. GCM10025709]|uniref:winged helix-turn-helix transcriptional regulator n=1 Tax=Haloarcula TaxID=2237 RepID=UPI0024C29CA8|nr:helix-turn-helix domain-containing protein [Halomicroarcula sp. YJ-61-S]
MAGEGETRDSYPSDRGGVRRATAILGRKWHPLLITTLLADGPLGFTELKTHLDGISDKVLSECLDELQNDGLVAREVIDDKPVRVEYSLTAAGEELEPVIELLREWSREHLGAVEQAP